MSEDLQNIEMTRNDFGEVADCGTAFARGRTKVYGFIRRLDY